MGCYREIRMIKSFRGLMAEDTQQRINLHTNDGKTGYRIVKFELMPGSPGLVDYEAVVKIFKVEQTSNLGTVDFSDTTLVGCAFYMADPSTANPNAPTTIVFDNEIFNQDIYITYKANTGSGTMNYYIELEQINLDLNESTVATLQSIRSA